MRRTTRSAFTLIELLIVVGIIAILAAIATPNFLEAQTRSKVSRAKSDMRTISVALETYKVDNNQYPEQGVPNGTNQFPFSSDVRRVYGGDSPRHAANNPPIAYHLSTPVAYLTSTKDVFRDPFFRGFNAKTTSLVNDTRYYNYSGDYYRGRIYDVTQDGDVATYAVRMQILNEVDRWHLRSRGPDTAYEKRAAGWEDFLVFHGAPGAGASKNGGINVIYDATNGTASKGDIVRLGTSGIVN